MYWNHLNWHCVVFCIALVFFSSMAYVFCLPAVERAARIKWMCDHPFDSACVFFFVTFAVLFGGSKGSTNPPPETVESPLKSIRIFVTAPDGRLIPLGAQIKGSDQ